MKFAPYFLLTLIVCFVSCTTDINMQTNEFDWQGHRGARGLFPENTIEAFLGALEFEEVTTLELDVVLSADNQVVVSHEPYMSEVICLNENGEEFENGKQFNIFKMNYEDIKKFDCGTKIHPKYPQQKKLKTYKPLLSEVIEKVEAYCAKNNRAKVFYDIEIKSHSDHVGTFFEAPKPYVQTVMSLLDNYQILNRVNLQSFDLNILEELHVQKSDNTISFLVENEEGFEANMEKLSFIADIYSPYYLFVTKDLVEKVHYKKMKLIPWTVNEEEEMKKLIALGVDGIITDYPNKIKAVENE